MLKILLSIVIMSLGWVLVTSPAPPGGTTPHLQEVFTGRCWDYQVTRYKGTLPRVDTDCETLWQEFFQAFAFKEPCNVTIADYSQFMQHAQQAIPENKAMFWSGTRKITHEYGELGQRFVTLEDTLIGYLASEYLLWCGQTSAPGINFDMCPGWGDCEEGSLKAYWSAASQTFVSNVRGNVTLMLDGSNPRKQAYRRSSAFSMHELPNLDTDTVFNVNVIVSHQLDKPDLETCTNGSLLDLKEDVEARGLEFNCVDDPQAIEHLLCSDEPDSRECQLVRNIRRQGKGRKGRGKGRKGEGKGRKGRGKGRKGRGNGSSRH